MFLMFIKELVIFLIVLCKLVLVFVCTTGEFTSSSNVNVVVGVFIGVGVCCLEMFNFDGDIVSCVSDLNMLNVLFMCDSFFRLFDIIIVTSFVEFDSSSALFIDVGDIIVFLFLKLNEIFVIFVFFFGLFIFMSVCICDACLAFIVFGVDFVKNVLYCVVGDVIVVFVFIVVSVFWGDVFVFWFFVCCVVVFFLFVVLLCCVYLFFVLFLLLLLYVCVLFSVLC